MECRYNCTFGHYGLGCRKMCDCSNQQICDSKQGCIEPFKGKSEVNLFKDMQVDKKSSMMI